MSLARKFFSVSLLALAGVAVQGRCQDSAFATADARPGVTRAARLTFIAGSVRVQRSDNTGDDTAVLNMPIPEGSRIITGNYGEAELEFEDGSVARVTPNSVLVLGLLSLDSGQTAHSELNLLSGLGYFELRKSAASTWQVYAGGVSIRPLENLTLRIIFDDPVPAFAVLTGSAQLSRSNGFQTDLRAGESLKPDGRDQMRYFLSQQIDEESWDSWNISRDQNAEDTADRRTAAREAYAGAQGYGWSDLDANGNWYDVPGAGKVWQPFNADEGFDPYGYGSWVWGSGSYLWASAYNWGWTPYRCGHWEYFPGFGWGWAPDASCGVWGFAGGGYLSTGHGGGYGSGIFIRGPYPPRHSPVMRPQPRPGQPHPVIPVRGPDGPRPPIIRGGQVRIAGNVLSPLPAVAPLSSHSGSSVGRSLTRDFPIDRNTHQPILGQQPADTIDSNQPAIGVQSVRRPSPGTRFPLSQSGEDGGAAVVRAPSRAPAISVPPPPQPERGPVPVGTGSFPTSIRTAAPAPGSAAPPAQAPPSRQAPQPVPQPAPVRNFPPPQQPAPPPPVHTPVPPAASHSAAIPNHA